jgi:hypothetical protein
MADRRGGSFRFQLILHRRVQSSQPQNQPSSRSIEMHAWLLPPDRSVEIGRPNTAGCDYVPDENVQRTDSQRECLAATFAL